MKILLSIFLALLVCDQATNGLRILGVFPLHGKSHWVMMEQLMLGLAKRGHQVDVVTHFPQKKTIPNYREISLKGSLEQVVNNITAADIKKFDSFSMKVFVEMTGDKVCSLMELPQLQELIKNPPKDPPYDLVITEVFSAPCYLAFGRHLNVPLIAAVTCRLMDWLNDPSGNPNGLAYVPGLFSSFSNQMTFWERLQNVLISHIITTQINYYTDMQSRYVKEYFGMDASIADLYNDVSLILVNSHFSLHGVRPYTTSIVEVGGLHINEKGDPLSPEVQKWLDESPHGCVLFTFGSMVRIETFPKEVVETFYKVFEKIAPVRVLMKVANETDLLPGLPKNVMTQPWFPQMSVLMHKNTKAFITHGGLMGTQESIHCGVPMVGLPLFGDQSININGYVKKKIAVSVGKPENVTVEKLTNALDTVLNNPIYRANIKKLSQLFKDRPQSALDTAIYWVEYVARHGKVLQSPAIHLTWWQRDLLDIYGFVILCTVLVLYIVLRVLRFLKKRLFGSKKCSKKQNKESKKDK